MSFFDKIDRNYLEDFRGSKYVELVLNSGVGEALGSFISVLR